MAVLTNSGIRITTWVALLPLMIFSHELGAQATARRYEQVVLVAGIADARTGAPLKGAELVLPALGRVARADDMGRLVMTGVPRGTHRVRVRMLGYAASDVDLAFNADTVGPVFMLERTPAVLDTVYVYGDRVPLGLREFDARRHLGLGRYLTETQLAKDGTRDFMLAMQSHLPGVRIMQDEERRSHLVTTRGNCGAADRASVPRPGRQSRRVGGAGMVDPTAGGSSGDVKASGSCFDAHPCSVQMYLDGLLLGDDDADIVRTWDLAGVEFYTGVNMPAQYRTAGSACGVLLLWSKH